MTIEILKMEKYIKFVAISYKKIKKIKEILDKMLKED